MLKIEVWMRGTVEYSRDIIPGPTLDQTQSEFEEAFNASDECYSSGYVYETCPYFQLGEDSRDVVRVYVEPNSADSDIKNSEKPVLTTSNWNQFEFVRCGGVDFVPEPCDDLSKVSIWWCHDMKFNKIFFWEKNNKFDPSKFQVQYGIDQNGRKYLVDLLYDNESADDSHDYGDSGYGYDGINFVYHPAQKFAEESDDE
jgi:hypothetical protein